MSLIRKLLGVTAPPQSVNPRNRTLRLIINALSIDRDGEVVKPDGGRVTAFLQTGGVVLYSHIGTLPVANALRLDVFADRIEAEIRFFGPGETPLEPELADTLWKLYSTGRMRAASIGFLPIVTSPEPVLAGQRGRTYLEWELAEFSLVAIPSLREAVTLSPNQVAMACKSLLSSPHPVTEHPLLIDARRLLNRVNGEIETVHCSRSVRQALAALDQLVEQENIESLEDLLDILAEEEG